MQEKNTENNHRYARTPSMILIPHGCFMQLAGIWPFEIQIFWDMMLHYWASGSCRFEVSMFLQKVGNRSPSDTASQVQKTLILSNIAVRTSKLNLILSYKNAILSFMYAPYSLAQSLHVNSSHVHSLNRENYRKINNFPNAELAFEIHKDINTLKCLTCGYLKFLTFFFCSKKYYMVINFQNFYKLC